ncbi:hypothetical protein DFP72DRAFT_844749 [Ephemerocybe angulata]|uniref:DUF7053 domain-containing protein n=1 Tax=Ephemerocybe angulata TaxID=980116 RepID=A0A8H6M8L5_9AGAR|nr:hypothetical protein DFP72DRAFT_844749 [Tulosesus angulatus]
MAILTSSRNFTYESHIKAPVQEVIAFLQDAPSLASQSPVFISIHIHPDTSTTEPYWHVITERVPIVGSIETSTRIRVRFLPTAEGVSCTVRASLGVRMQTDYVVEEKSEGESLLKESTTMKASVFLINFTYPIMRDAHKTIIDSIAARAVQSGGLKL